jgi:hypothetical protein
MTFGREVMPIGIVNEWSSEVFPYFNYITKNVYESNVTPPDETNFVCRSVSQPNQSLFTLIIVHLSYCALSHSLGHVQHQFIMSFSICHQSKVF